MDCNNMGTVGCILYCRKHPELYRCDDCPLNTNGKELNCLILHYPPKVVLEYPVFVVASSDSDLPAKEVD